MFEHRIEELARIFRIAVGQQLQGPPQVGKQHRHPFALALQCTFRHQDLLGEMPWRIGVRRDEAWLRVPPSYGVPALGTELRGLEEPAATIGAGPPQQSGALLTELGLWGVLVLAPGTLHTEPVCELEPARGGHMNRCGELSLATRSDQAARPPPSAGGGTSRQALQASFSRQATVRTPSTGRVLAQNPTWLVVSTTPSPSTDSEG